MNSLLNQCAVVHAESPADYKCDEIIVSKFQHAEASLGTAKPPNSLPTGVNRSIYLSQELCHLCVLACYRGATV
jgi:hypothetical protein